MNETQLEGNQSKSLITTQEMLQNDTEVSEAPLNTLMDLIGQRLSENAGSDTDKIIAAAGISKMEQTKELWQHLTKPHSIFGKEMPSVNLDTGLSITSDEAYVHNYKSNLMDKHYLVPVIQHTFDSEKKIRLAPTSAFSLNFLRSMDAIRSDASLDQLYYDGKFNRLLSTNTKGVAVLVNLAYDGNPVVSLALDVKAIQELIR